MSAKDRAELLSNVGANTFQCNLRVSILTSGQNKWAFMRRLLALALVFSILAPVYIFFPDNRGSDLSNVDVHPGRGSMIYKKCSNYSHPFKCATLTTPLDYTNLDDPRNASIAVIQYPAGGGNTSNKDVLGSIILNPGGPGGSGLEFLTRQGSNNKTLAETLDKIFEGKYNLVSFDPRGVGETWPKVSCFEEDMRSFFYETVALTNGLPGTHGAKLLKHDVGVLIAEQQLLSDVCQASNDSQLLSFLGTSFVARDMQLMHRALGDTKLNYWGFSYGTVLGSTYADMFPDDIDHLLIDGVVDVPNYYKGKWSHNFKDIEAELDHFFRECYDSGSRACKMGKLGSSAEDLKEQVMNWGESLKTKPIAVATAEPPQIFDYYQFIAKIFTSLYVPSQWPKLADSIYDAIAVKNVTGLLWSKERAVETLAMSHLYNIACGDSLEPPVKSPWGIEDYDLYVSSMVEDSPHFAGFFARIGLMCNGIWQNRASEIHKGNFTSTTSFPLLAIGNDYDPVTPREYAEKMANLFPNAVSVRRKGYGHCSTSQPSKCIEKVIRDYFIDNQMPSVGTVCTVDNPIFENKKFKKEGGNVENADDFTIIAEAVQHVIKNSLVL